MSFGFSVGDFFTVIQFASKLRKDFAGAPDQFEAISDELRSLSFVLYDVDVALSKSGTDDQQSEIRDILNSCHNVLSDIENVLEKNIRIGSKGGSLGNRAKLMWDKVNWQPEDIRELRDRLISNITLLNTFLGRISSGVISETKRGVDQLNQRQADQDRLDILNWLTPIDYTSQQYDFFNRRQPGTGQWLLDSPEYKTWLQEPGKTLFCPGIPGAGKTILASIIINSLTTRFHIDPTTGVAYIYCNFRRRHEQTVDHLLATLLKQLAEHRSHLPKTVTELFDRHKEKRTRPLHNEILTTLRSAIATYTRVFIVVDALDECSISDGCLERFLSELSSLQTDYKVNIFTTSRIIPEVTDRFSEDISLEIRATDEDVQSYIEGHVSQLPAFVRRNPDMQKEIARGVVNAVNGMFLLAQLHLDSLKGKRSPKALRVALKNLATGSDAYDHAYDDAMERIACQLEDEKELAKQALAWIVCAKRPLTTAELQHALAVEPNEEELDDDNLSEIEDIVSACVGLVTVDEQSDIIRLVHYTTQDYFERTRSRWFPDADADISTVCMTYLSFRAFNSGPCRTAIEYKDRVNSHNLYVYAARNWGCHAHNVNTLSLASNSFLEDKSQSDAASQALMAVKYGDWDSDYTRRFPRQMTGLHLASCFGVENVIRLLLHGNGLNSRNSYGQTPVSLAAKYGHGVIVKLLLEKGADFESKDEDGETPLFQAAANGHEAIVKLLLDKGADFKSKDKRDWTPLRWAARNGHEAIVKLLLDKGTDFESKDKRDWTPLFQAAANGHEAIVKLLLEKGADFESKDEDGETPLFQAAANGHEAIVKLLLDKGADFESKNKHGETPLFWPARKGHEAIVKLLLDKGAWFDLKDGLARTPLSWAAAIGHKAIVKLLLEKGADFESKGEDGRTPLSWAVTNGGEAIVSLLLEKGANFHSTVELDEINLS